MFCAGKGRSFQAASGVEMVLERPKEVEEHGKEVGGGIAKFVR